MTSRHAALGLEQMRLGNASGAIPHFKAALAEDPDDAEVHAHAALCLIDTGYPEAAARMAHTAIRLAPDDAYAHLVVGVVAVARRDYSAARTHLEESRRLDHTQPEVYRWLAEINDRSGRRQDILPILEAGLAYDPDNIRLLTGIGSRYLDLGHLDEAERYARDALALNPENDEANVLQGHVLLRRGQVDAAWDNALVALRQDATDPPTLRLVCSLKARGNPIALLWWRLALWIERLGNGAPLYAALMAVLLGYYVVARILLDLGLRGLAVALAVPIGIFVVGILYGARRIKRILDHDAAHVKLRRDY